MEDKKIIKNFTGVFQGMNINFGKNCTINNMQVGSHMTMVNGKVIKDKKIFIKCFYCGGQKEKTAICPGCGAR